MGAFKQISSKINKNKVKINDKYFIPSFPNAIISAINSYDAQLMIDFYLEL